MHNRNQNSEALITIIRNTIQQEGFFVLFRGWLPAYLRLGPHAIICFPLFEKIRYIFGLDYI
jgi:hypothetical protein